MLWLYWRRMRAPVLAIFLALASLAGLAVGAGLLVGSDSQEEYSHAPAARPGAQFSHPALPVSTAGQQRGLELMSTAVSACETVSYRGVQMVAWWGPQAASAYLIQIWHRAGTPELTLGTSDIDAPASPVQQAGSTRSGHVTSGVLTVAPWMLTLMRSNYLIEYVGSGSAIGRPAFIVAIRRRNGTLAARYWLDRATGLPLRREIFDTSGRLVNEGAFIDLHVGDADVKEVPPPSAPAWASQPPATTLTALRRAGWPVPASLAGDMSLVSITRTGSQNGSVLDASYSNGLSVVSVFVQRGRLPRKMPGWHVAEVSGERVYASEPDQRSIAWAAEGFVYTVIADAPPTTVARIVAELPHERSQTFWQRVGRGLIRLTDLINPFR